MKEKTYTVKLETNDTKETNMPSSNGILGSNSKYSNSTSFGPNNDKGKGRTEGSKNKATILIEEMGLEQIQKIWQQIIDAATGKLAADSTFDLQAANSILDRILPRRRGSRFVLDLPDSPKKITNAQELQQEANALRNARRDGIISPEEQALEMANLDSISGKILADIEHRMNAGLESIKDK